MFVFLYLFEKYIRNDVKILNETYMSNFNEAKAERNSKNCLTVGVGIEMVSQTNQDW